jgi:hypothetical protein
MEAIFEGLIAVTVLLVELIVSVYLELLEVAVQILVALVGWICAPFWSKEHRREGVPDPWKIAIRRTAAVILILGIMTGLWWGWLAFGKPAIKPPSDPPAQETESDGISRRVWKMFEEKLKEQGIAQP